MRKLLLFAAALAPCGEACAQAYPARPIRLVVGFAPGGAADSVARAIGDQLAKQSGATAD